MTQHAAAKADGSITGDHQQFLLEIQDRVLWLAMQLIHHANKVRENPDGSKVGGHPASCASMVTVLTSLFFDYMKPGDRIAVKPHASPVYHAIQYLLGNLDQKYLKTLREYHGLQAYPSRTKDPDPVDFSTGSVGLGAVAPNFAAVADRYVRAHFPENATTPRRFISVIGDSELDEGSVWEALVEPVLGGDQNVLWVVDVNRQSLDRTIPGIRVQLWRQMFAASGWQVIDAKYGTHLEAAFQQPHGELLRVCVDEMSNEVYQRLLRLPLGTLRQLLPQYSRHPQDLKKFIEQWDDRQLLALFGDLGGHDFATLRRAFARADSVSQPSVVLAYTFKGWRLPMVAMPQNHSLLLSNEHMEQLRQTLGIPAEGTWSGFNADTPVGHFCAERGRELRSGERRKKAPADLVIPSSLNRTYKGALSTQDAMGQMLTELGREVPKLAERMVTVSPDVATSTNLGGWINKVDIWSQRAVESLPDDDAARSLGWKESPLGRHVQLGICESNLFMMLGQLGLTHEMCGELLFPIGTLYDPFVVRGLEAFMWGPYSGSHFIVAGTPSGVTLSPEGGAHQSVITPSIGIELPGVAFYEPCFAQELEWILLAGMHAILHRRESTYLRLTTKTVDQALLRLPTEPARMEDLRRQVLAGAYRLIDRSGEPGYLPGENVVHIFTSGAMVPEAIQASERLRGEGLLANVINITSADRLFRRYQDAVSSAMTGKSLSSAFLEDVIARGERIAPLVTVADGHPHGLAWLGSALGTRAFSLGVSRFGQSGARPDIYREYRIDADSITHACLGALEASDVES